MHRIRRGVLLAAAGVVLAGSGVACGITNAAPTTAQCAVIVGNGGNDDSSNGTDRNFHNVTFPGGKVKYDQNTESVHYFACGPRNYKINDGTLRNANDQKVGDRSTPTVVWTKATTDKPSIQVNVWSSTYWTPNQGTLKEFYPLCAKYHCYTDDAGKAADANYSEPGWNGMLGENFGGVIDTSVMFALNGSLKDEHGKPKQAAGFDSNIVTDTGQWVTLGELMSEDFMTRVRTVTGISNVDLFCGSGSGGWKEPTKPGEGEFTCNNVRVMIDKVEPTDPEVRKAMAASGTLKLQEQANKDRVTAAQQLYGDQWAWVLGVQDTIEKCQANDKQVCVINVGSGNVTVPVPTRG